MEAKM